MMIFVLAFSHVESQTLAQMKQLHSDVFSNLDKGVIPVSDASLPLNISITFYPSTVVDFQEVDETLVLTAGINMQWRDDGISWTPSSYGNANSILVSQDEIWSPKIILFNTVENIQLIEGDITFDTRVFSDGNVSHTFIGLYHSKCTADISKFPFDTQKCYLKFGAIGLDESVIKITSENGVNDAFFVTNSDWELTKIDSEVKSWNGYSSFIVTLSIKRAPLYYSVIVVMPALIFGVMNLLVFILPEESGERIGFAMTTLLSYTIFLTLVTSAIPASSNPMSRLVLILIVAVILSAAVAVATIFGSNLYHRDENQKKHRIWLFIATKFPWSKNPSKVKPIIEGKETPAPFSWNDIEVKWRDVCYSYDLLCMILFGIATFILACVFFTIAA